MESNYTPVNLEDRARYYALWQQTPRHALDYTLANLWGWRDYFGLEWRFSDNLCWIRQKRPEPCFWAPLGDWNAVNWPELLPSLTGASFIRIPEELALLWRAALPGLTLTEDRGQWEYLYKQDELATLPGKLFHKKRTHCHNYLKAFGTPDYRPLTEAMVEDVFALQDDWCQWHECAGSPSLRAENEAINRVLSQWNTFHGLKGGSLYIDGRMVAFSVGEDMDGETLGVHFEKGLNGFPGVYQTINQLVAQNAGAGFRLVNRAQDMNEEGLRQAKMTYNPVDFLRKYQVRLAG